MKLSTVNQLVQRRYLTQAAKAEVADLASITHCFEAFEHSFGSEYISRRQTETLRRSTLQRDSGMKLNKIDAISIESLESRFDRLDRSCCDIVDGIGL